MKAAEPLYACDKNVWNDTFATYPKEKDLPYFIAEIAKKYAGKTAIKFNGRELSYQQLNETSNKLARLLLDHDIQKGDIVALALDRSPEMIMALLAILKSGAAYVPLDPEYPKDRVEFMLEDSSAKILLTSNKYHASFQSDAAELLIEDAWKLLDGYDASAPEVNVAGDDLAYVLYTSGSTGKPKGVMIKHYNLVNFLLSMQKEPGMNADDKILAVTTISFDIAGLELYLPLISGAQIILADTITAKDGRLLLEIVKKERISFMQATPYTWRMMLEAGWNTLLPVKILCGGEALPKDLANKLTGVCGELWNMYGPTETTVWSTLKLIESADDISIGKPVDNTQVYILDENLNVLTDGAAGEIFIAGDGVAKGYLNRPGLTGERFVTNPFSAKRGDKMYRTGDLGKFNLNGEIQCLGRIDHQVKVRGYRIELEEIEHALINQADVKEAVVVAREDIPGDVRLVGYTVLTPDADVTDFNTQTNNWRRALLAVLPEYMVPDDFVLMELIPITPNGKTDRKALPKPDYNAVNRGGEYVAPQTDDEKLVAGIWEELMGLEKISIHDNFFSLGGRSLVAIKVMARIEEATGKHLPLATLFDHSTIQQLALCIRDDSKSKAWNSLVPIKATGTRTPLYIVHGEGLNVLFFNSLALNMDKEQPVYGLQARGLEGEGEALDVTEDIAANFIAEIIDQNPTGPYILAGFCFGGYIAVEMRNQLVAMGKEVKMLIMFNTDAEKSEFKSLLYLLPRKLKRHVPKLISFLKTKVKHALSKDKFEDSSPKTATNILSGEGSGSFYQKIKSVTEKNLVAFKNYALKPFDDKVYLFKAKIPTYYVDDAESLGWKEFAKRGVELYEVPGDHLSMIESPNVEVFGPILQRSIDECSR